MQRQRAHFARARNRPQQSPSTPLAPFHPEFLRGDDDRHLRRSVSEVAMSDSGNVATKRHSGGAYCSSPTAQTVQNKREPEDTSAHFAKVRHHDGADKGE